ncbi:myotubularin-related protein 11 isoform X3 [Mauremys mutica]|uniref:myotubularin-related protein 11 isoform X3 n=1 Tax=Mauremys mutica TaxID=74926 RepID=UPI001D15FDBA|nr:myotubularin-related protein 11 isoform X3 [Mauremys mutica]
MLSGSKNSFKIQQHKPGPALRGPKSSDMNSGRNRNCQAFPCIPGEHVLEAAAHVRKIVRSRDGEGSILGTLYCTNLRVAFVPEPAPGDTVGAPRCSTCLHSEHDVALPKYLWVPSRLLDNELKRAFGHFNARRIPRLCWHHPGGSDLLRAAGFHADSDPEKEDVRSVEALMLAGHAQCVIVETAADLPSPAEIQLSYLKLRALCLPDSSVADEKWLSALEGTRWLEHVRACVRKACEVAALLAERSRSIMLQGRVSRSLLWPRHRLDALRLGQVCESDDRDLNCLLASLVQVLWDPHARTQSGFQSLLQKEWVVAGHPFLQRLNLLRDNDREESPVFLLFLDCVWQLLQQFPASFEFTETYLVALHDSSYIPFFSTFLFNCQWERDRRNQHRASNQIYAPVNGWREPPPLEILQKGGRLAKERGGPYLPTIWDWALRYTTQQRAQFRNPAYARGSGSTTVPNGKSAPLGGDKLEAALSGNGTMYLFAKGALSPQTHLFPWKNGSLSKKGWRRAQSSESLSEQDRSLRSSPSGCPLQSEGLLLPASVGPLIRLWRRCYLRGSQEVQRGLFASTLAELAEELDLLRERLGD